MLEVLYQIIYLIVKLMKVENGKVERYWPPAPPPPLGGHFKSDMVTVKSNEMQFKMISRSMYYKLVVVNMEPTCGHKYMGHCMVSGNPIIAIRKCIQLEIAFVSVKSCSLHKGNTSEVKMKEKILNLF